MTQKQLQSFFLELIRSAVCGEPVSAAADETDVRAVCALARRQDVLSMAVAALKENGYPVSDALTRRQYTAVWRSEQMTHELTRIGETLRQADIPFVPLKGAVVRDLYPQTWMRVSADIDLLVHEEDLPRATEALAKELSYQVGHKSHHDVTLTAPSGQTLELHYNLHVESERLDAVLDTVWTHTVTEGSAVRLTPEFQIFYGLAHLAYHFSHAGSGVRPFVDLWLLRTKTDYDEAAVRALCDESGLDRFYDASCRLTRRWFTGDDTPDDLLDEMQEYCFSGGIFGTQKQAETAARRGKGKRQYLLRRVFMPRDSMEKLYPQLKEHPYRLPYYEVKRWGKLLRPETRAHFRQEAKLNQNTDAAAVERTHRFLSRLGL